MATRQSVDYIIVGQGLAGSALALQMKWRNRSVVVVDKGASESSSAIAAGIFNPLTGKKMGKTWMAEVLFPYLKTFYQKAETLTSKKFFFQRPIYRPFLNIAEQNEWAGSLSGSAESFLASVETKALRPDLLDDDMGGLILNQGGFIDTATYLSAVRGLLESEGSIREEVFDYRDCRISHDKVIYQNLEASAIIFCEGTRVAENPYFNWVPIIPLKGEIIAVRGKFLDDLLVNRGIYIVPAGEDEWRVGATYEHHFDHPGISESGKSELLRRLRMLVTAPLDLVGQYAGIRPTTPDRRPILGIHPECRTVYIFNGLGTKGVSLSPYFSEALLQNIEHQLPLVKEVDINRYYSLYWNSR